MSQHTPGSWHQPIRYSAEDGTDVPCGSIEDSRGRPIAVISWPERSSDQIIANARLIAASPDLLEALQELVAEHDFKAEAYTAKHPMCFPKDTYGVELARAAIAKATQ